MAWDGGTWPSRAKKLPSKSATISDGRGETNQADRARQFRPIRGVKHLPMGSADGSPSRVLAWFSPDGRTTYSRSLSQITRADLVGSFPTRDFSRRNSQSHKPVAVWTHTTQGHVHCESRLEREFVLLADFDKRVEHIAAQPFTLTFSVGWPLQKHTVDFVVLNDGQPPIAVDVKTPKAAVDPKNVERHELIRGVLAEAGIHHVVWTGVPFDVVNNLAQFGKATPTEETVLKYVPALLLSAGPPMPAGTLARRVAHEFNLDRGIALYVIKHLLWTGAMTTDMATPYGPEVHVRFHWA